MLETRAALSHFNDRNLEVRLKTNRCVLALAIAITVTGCQSAAKRGANPLSSALPGPNEFSFAVSGDVGPSPNPSYHQPTPGITQAAMPLDVRPVTANQLLVSWEAFDDPRLRWMQKTGLQNASDSADIAERLRNLDLQSSGAIRGDSGFIAARQELTIEIARLVVLARYQHHRLATLKRLLKQQEDTYEEARIRFEVGSVDQTELVSLVARAQETEAMVPGEQRKLDSAIEKLEQLVGQPLTQPLRDAIGDQSQLDLSGIDDSIEANRLKRRIDVGRALLDIQRLRGTAGFPETEVYPTLSLRGEIRPHSANNERSEPSVGIGLDFGGGDSLEIQIPEAPIPSGGSGISSAMAGYYTVVSRAATEVRDLLTEFIQYRQERERANQASELADARVRKAISRFTIGKASVEEIAEAQRDWLTKYNQLHQVEYHLANAALELFIALGGPYQAGGVAHAAYYDR